MSRRSLGATGLIAIVLLAGCGGGGGSSSSGTPVAFREVEAVFAKHGCGGCHPLVNPSLNLQPGKAYASLVGIQALEDPRLVRVVAGDPDRSFLYQKIAGDPKLGDIPAIGGRMPPGQDRIRQADIDIVRIWIAQGAKNAEGQTVGPTVPSPGEPGASPVGAPAERSTGDATITGVVQDQLHRPMRGAIVTLLLRSPSQPGGEEHYRAAVTDAAGRYTLKDAPAGQFLLKAYAPRSIYVSRIVALQGRETARVDFGLPSRRVPNPSIARPAATEVAGGTRLAMEVSGSALDPNYTLAVNAAAGIVVELHRADGGPGLWSATIPRRLKGPWTFLAVDHGCNISAFLTA